MLEFNRLSYGRLLRIHCASLKLNYASMSTVTRSSDSEILSAYNSFGG